MKMESDNWLADESLHMRDQEVQDAGNDDHHKSGSGIKAVKRDIFDLESRGGAFGDNTRQVVTDWGTIMKLAFQCIGVVYGDLGTSPLYTLPGIFPSGIHHSDDLLGVLSLIIYSLLLISLFKYVFIVLAANDNGDGGTFAIYSLICRHVKINLMPNQQVEDDEVVDRLELGRNSREKRASVVKSMLEKSYTIKYILLLLTMLGVSMLLGDGVLTPCISVLSAIGGIKEKATSLSQDVIMWVSAGILVLLFQIQRFGTDKVGYSFAPVLVIWFAFIALIGVYNFAKYDPGVIRALNPWYIVRYFQRNKKDAWVSLGGVILCLTGSEALFADLGHFTVRSIQISTCAVLIPSVTLAYIGQCSYLRKYPADAHDAFYKSIPELLYWPQFIVAVLAAIIASQSLISASFAIVQQAVALGCFPRVKVVHTSTKYEGQVYVPEINTLLMIACVGVTLGFKNTQQIGNAYGIAVAFVFVITSSFLVLVMITIWKTNMFLIILYVLTIMLIELVFLSSVLYKFTAGGYLPLLFALIVIIVMFVWNYGYRKKYVYELDNKVSLEQLTKVISNPRIKRVEGLGLFYTQLVQGVTPVFIRYVSTVPAVHKVLIFVSIKSLAIISKVPAEDRFFFQRVNPRELIFRCIVRYGYKDSMKDHETFEEMLVIKLKKFMKDEGEEKGETELEEVDNSLREGGIVYLMGEGEMMSHKGSNCAKKILVDYGYNWLNRIVRQPYEYFLVPQGRLLKVGMTYQV